MITRILVLLASLIGLSVLAPAQHIQWVQPNPPGFVTINDPGCGFRAVTPDLNGDGIPDILAHDGYASIAGMNNAGRIAVFSGADGSLVREHQGTVAGEFLGLCGGSIGDVDGDGVADYLTGSQVQGVRIVSGATGIFGPPISVSWGWWCMGLGDVNGDGINDFVVSDGACATTISGATHAQLYSLCVFNPANPFGASMDTVGDVDADGVTDFVIGCPTPNNQIVSISGHVYLVSGATGVLLHTFASTGITNQFGKTVTGLGDVNGDGSPDVLIGAPGPGQAFVYSCVPPYGLIYSLAGGPTAYNTFGLMSAALGDVDGDGWPDYALLVEGGAQFNGVVAVKSGPTGATLTTLPVPANYAFQGFGRGGDLDADGFEDVLVGYLPWPPTQPWPDTFARISTIPTGMSPLGTGCPQSTGVTARIGATKPASSGQSVGITLSSVAPGTPVGLIVGLSATQFGSTPLPLDLGSAGMPGCSLLASIDLFLPQVTAAASGGAGSAVRTFSIPTGLTGATYYGQWAVLSPPGIIPVGSMTRALSVTIQ